MSKILYWVLVVGEEMDKFCFYRNDNLLRKRIGDWVWEEDVVYKY